MPFIGKASPGRLLRQVMALQAGVQRHFAVQPPTASSLLSVEAQEDVVVTAIKPGRDDRSVVVRLWNTGATVATVQIHSQARVSSACLCDLKEDSVSPLQVDGAGTVELTVIPHGLATVSMEMV
jgi:alpha-mannosidase